MKPIKVCIHCSATRENQRFTFEDCRKFHMTDPLRGYSDIGYNLYIERDGSIHQGRPFGSELAHAKGHNTGFLAICYEGGLDANGKAKDTRTDAQKQSMLIVRLYIERMYNVTKWLGHRDLSPDRDGDGVIMPDEWLKECPCFDVKSEFK